MRNEMNIYVIDRRTWTAVYSRGRNIMYSSYTIASLLFACKKEMFRLRSLAYTN
jgi:hypothetical protein